MLKTFKMAALAATMVFSTGQIAMAGNVPESTDPIKVINNDWTGQLFSTAIVGGLLQEMGYNIEYVSAGALPQHPGIAQGNLHLQTEVWTNNVGDLYPGLVDKGDIVVVGNLGLEPKEGWIYPPYMEEKCPGLPNYKALFECQQAFANASTFPKGRLITYPADWGTRSRDLVASVNMPFEPIPGGSEGAMMAELKSAYAAEEPILMMIWQPHWIFADLDLNWVEWNKIEGECVEESQEKETACGFQQAEVHKVVWGGFEEKWPAAFKMVSNFTLTNEDENWAIFEVDNNGRDVKDVAKEWLSKNENLWRGWIKAAM
jgi:glycine betaine/proline transport system substrate-binding protein